MGEDSLFAEIEGYLKQEGRKAREQKLLEHGLLLSLLVLRGVTTKTKVIDIRPKDRDGSMLMRLLVSPGLAPDLAVSTTENTAKGEVTHIEPDWERVADYFGRDMEGFRDLFEKRFPKVVRKHRFTIEILLNYEE